MLDKLLRTNVHMDILAVAQEIATDEPDPSFQQILQNIINDLIGNNEQSALINFFRE